MRTDRPVLNGLAVGVVLTGGLLIGACNNQHQGRIIENFQGDYRYASGIGEFFDCKSRVRYYVHDSSANRVLIREFQKLGLRRGEDAYVRVKGYLMEAPQMDGVDPVEEFVPVEFIGIDPARGCKQEARQGL